MLSSYISYIVVLIYKAGDFFAHGGARDAPHRLRLELDAAARTGEAEEEGGARQQQRKLIACPPPRALHDIWYQTYDFLTSSASQILDLLWLGNALNAADVAFMRRVPIQAVVNLSAEVPNVFEKEILYCTCHSRDIIGCTLPLSWISRFIHAQLTRGRAVLVHCFIGRSRSVAAVCHYLMTHRGHSFEEAYEHVSRRRPMACINADLARQLRENEDSRPQALTGSCT